MMYITVVVLAVLFTAQAREDKQLCDGFQAHFSTKAVIGPWYVVAIVPEKSFPDKEVSCYKVEFSETDGAGLRWLANRTLDSQEGNVTQNIQGTIVRQRYHNEHPFDVWSKSVEGINGCFQQVMSLEADNTDMHKGTNQEAVMQLHVLENGANPFLLQMLWGKLISAVVYRKDKGVTQDQLKPAYELLTKLRGPQRLPRICTKHLREPIVFY